MMTLNWNIPESWALTTLGETADIIRGISFPKSVRKLEPQEGFVACLRTANVQREVNWGDLWFVPEEYVKLESRYVQLSDVLISVSNSLELVGKVAFVSNLPQKSTLGAFISLIRFSSSLDTKFYYYQIASPDMQSEIRSSASTTTNISNVSSSKLSGISLSVPPLAEQHRIVAEIEKQFTRLDASVAGLKRVQANLKRYRASVLKAACEGKLVPTEAELARSEAREHPAWEIAQPLGRAADQRVPYPAQPIPRDLLDSNTPEGWELKKLRDISLPVEKASPRDSPEETFTYLDISSIDNSLLRVVSPKTYLGKDAPSRARQRIWSGNILFSTVRIYLKNIAIVPTEFNGEVGSTGFCVINPGLEADSRFIFYVVQTNEFINQLNPLQRGSSYPAVRNDDVMNQELLLPPLAEQRRIVAEVERRLSIIQQAEEAVEASLTRAERMRQSILKQAFSGKLVPQDSNDEPASVLLERIQAERETQGVNQPKTRVKRRIAKSSAGQQAALGIQERTS